MRCASRSGSSSPCTSCPTRASGGRIGGSVRGGRVGLVTHRGARTEHLRTTTLTRLDRGDTLVPSFFAECERATSRGIPVVVLEPA